MAGTHAARLACGEEPVPLPRATALGSLCHYISAAESKSYQPANIAFDLLPPLEPETDAERKRFRDKKQRRAEQCRRAHAALDGWLEQAQLAVATTVE